MKRFQKRLTEKILVTRHFFPVRRDLFLIFLLIYSR